MTRDADPAPASNSAPVPALVFISGPAAVGKMTVGQALRDLTGFQLLYNHMALDLVTEFADFGPPPFHLPARPVTTSLLDGRADHPPAPLPSPHPSPLHRVPGTTAAHAPAAELCTAQLRDRGIERGQIHGHHDSRNVAIFAPPGADLAAWGVVSLRAVHGVTSA